MFKNDTGDIFLSIAAFFQTVILMLQLLLIDSNTVNHDSFREISILLSAIPMVPAFYFVIKRKLILLVITYLLVSFLILTTLILFPENEQYLNSEFLYLIGINIPCFLSIASIKSLDILKRVLLYISFIIFAIAAVYIYFLWTGKIVLISYNMALTYYLLLPSLVFISQRKMYYNFIYIIIGIIMLLVGSRGALFTAIIYPIILLFIDKNGKSLLFASSIIMFILIFSSTSLQISLSERAGIESRTINLIHQGSIAESSGRSDIFYITWNSILDKPLLGHGLYGDRIALNGSYCHNVYLEILHNFGMFFGSGLIIIITLYIIQVFQKSNSDNKKLILLLFCYSFIPLMVSKSYLNDPTFGIFLGALYSISKNSKITGDALTL